MIIAYTALHYGSPYLGYAIRSVIDDIDKYYVLYCAHASHGATNIMQLPPSESRESLQTIAKQEAGNKLVWIDGDWNIEGQQRDSIHEYCPEADLILVLDYDEIWNTGLARQAIVKCMMHNAKTYRLPMVHFWRNFNKAFLHDPALPIRIIKPSGNGECYLDTSHKIAHMGYAIPTGLLQYKMHIHGHRAELRQDDWFTKKWCANAQEDCHPVGSDHWNTEDVNPLDYMPVWMQSHPYYGLKVIP